MLLAIDTSTNGASLALVDDERVVASHAWAIGQRHSVEIFAALDDLFRESARSFSAITAIGVATGPGSFNGARVAVTTAKTLAYVWGAALFGVTTLDAIAQTQANVCDGATILAVLEAGRGELYAGWYDLDVRSGVVAARATITLLSPDAPLDMAAARERIWVAGEATPDHIAALRASLAGRATFAEPFTPANRALGVATVARARLARGEADSPLSLEPAYVRRPNITSGTRHRVAPEP